ncbi:restriction endonuclease subunit S [Aliarcobacter butzleri]|uniref:restriction endonuclease subunit S n=1 Tax=Aliarcobacter butzleri TaxID=28197 RepID=UPI002B24C236|nr:restriction endonuclease subunit S [Aliarcobacter butzleri]
MMSKSKVPQIRFKGFSEEWEERKIEDIGDLKNGMNFGKEAMGHGFPFVNLQDVFGKNIVNDNHLELAFSNETQRKEYNLLKGDVLFIRSSVKTEGVGQTAIITKNLKDTTYSGFIIRFRPKIEMNLNFSRFIYTIPNIRKQILSSATSSANTNINQESLNNIQLLIPNYLEQTKIGDYFQQLDKLIEQKEKKYQKLKQFKKAMLNKMFPKNGDDTPEIRFKGFSSKWEEKSLSELIEYKNGKGHEDKQTLSGKYELINLNSISIDGGLKHSGKFVNETESTLNENDLVMVLSDVGHGDLLGRVALIPENNKFVLNQRVALLRPFNNIIPQFLFYNINVNQKYFKMQGAGMSQLNISKSSVESFISYIPSDLKEQQKIGNYFQKLDKQIELQQKELEKLKNIKKASLSKMFV